jgi:hypothetical protein
MKFSPLQGAFAFCRGIYSPDFFRPVLETLDMSEMDMLIMIERSFDKLRWVAT